LLEAEEDYASALVDYDAAAHLTPDDPQAHLGRGSVLIGLRAYDRARDAFDRVIMLDHENVEARVNKADALRLWSERPDQSAKYAEAEAAARDALRLAPQNSVAHAILGAVLSEQGRHEEAIAELDEARHIDPGYRWACWIRGKALYRSGNMERALEAIGALAAQAPEYAVQAAVGQAMIHRHLGQAEEADAALQRALDGRPTEADAFLCRAGAFEEFEAWNEAVADYRQAAALAPERAAAHNCIAWYQCEKLGTNLEECVAEAELAVRYARGAEQGNYYDTLGWIWYRRGDLERAQCYLHEALRLAEGDILIRAHMETVKQAASVALANHSPTR